MALKSPAYRPTPLRRLLPLLSAVALLLAACHRAPDARLALADSLMEERPDSALAVLDSIPSASLSSASDRALHALLLTQARHKNYIDETSDSLISTAVGYFSAHHVDSLLMRALYYQGKINFNAGDLPQAIVNATNAYKIAETNQSTIWLARSAELMADIFGETYNYSDDITYSTLAADYYKKARRTANHRYALYDLAIAYANSHNYGRAIELLDSVRLIALEGNQPDTSLAILAMRKRIPIAVFCQNYVEADSCIRELYLLKPHYELSQEENIYLAETNFHLNHHPDSVIKNVEKLLHEASDTTLYTYTMRLAAMIARHKGDLGQAVNLQDSIIRLIDKKTDYRIRTSVLNAQRNFFQSIAAKAERHSQSIRTTFLCTLVALLIIITVVIIILRLRLKLRKSQIDNYMQDIIELSNLLKVSNHTHDNLVESLMKKEDSIFALQNKISEQNLDIERFTKEIESIRQKDSTDGAKYKAEFKKRWTVLNDLACLYFETNSDSDVDKKMIYEKVRNTLDNFCTRDNLIAMRTFVDENLNNIITNLSSQCPDLSFDDISLATLVYAGFSPKAVCLFTNSTLTNFYARRKRLAEKIRAANAPDCDTFVSNLGLRSNIN